MNIENHSLLPRWQCHKQVHAAKITAIAQSPATADGAAHGGTWDLTLEGGMGTTVPHHWIVKHGPVVGGYYVGYDDGYASFSPAATFEAGYTLLPDEVTA